MNRKRNTQNIEEDRLFAYFDDNDEALTELLRRMGILEHLQAIQDPADRLEVTANVIRDLRSTLEEINGLPINKPKGLAETKFKIRNKHFNLHKLVFSTLELAGGALALITVAPLTVAAAGAVIAAPVFAILGKLKEIVHTLTPEELSVYKAIAGVLIEKEKKTLVEKRGANVEEIKGYFLAKKEAPLKLDAVLKSLESKHVIEPFAGGDGQTLYYKIVP